MTVVEVNVARCEGHGLCEQTAPQIYRLNDDGLVELLVDEITPDLLARAEAGARLCPVNALRLVDAPASSRD